MISAVARIMRPGVKADCVLILEGDQGIKKSTALRVLGDPWFTDEIAELGSKDAALQAAGVWIVELGELASMRRAEMNRVKAYISRTTDRYRPPYGRLVVERPRECVFAGSVNEREWHDDVTGARRFWPVKCNSIDIDSLHRDRDQLWAEAVARYKAKEPHYLHEMRLIRLAQAETGERKQVDPWEPIIGDWLAHQIGTETSVRVILGECLKLEIGKIGIPEQMRVGRILTSWGWQKYRPLKGRVREWRYSPPEMDQAEEA
jgi:predicted P-loop ATPase